MTDACPPEENLYAIVAGDGREADQTHVSTCERCQGELRKLQSEATVLRHVGQSSRQFEAETPEDDTPATIGDKFVVLGLWNDGPAFVTYRGLHAMVRQDVLIQVAKTLRGDDPALLEAFQANCARWMESRQHVAQVLDAGEHESRPYIVVKFDSGVRVDRLAAQEELDSPTLLRLFGEAAQALAADDLPPHPQLRGPSLVLEEDDSATVVDWAAAVLFGAGTDSSVSTARALATEFCQSVLRKEFSPSATYSVAELSGRLTGQGIPSAAAELAAKAVISGAETPSLAALASAFLTAQGGSFWRRIFPRS